MAAVLSRLMPASGEWPSAIAKPAGGHKALARAIEMDIVPRLVLGRSRLAAQSAPIEFADVPEDVLNLASLALGRDDDMVDATILEAATRGSFELLCLDLLAPTARHLGDLWTDDLCSFADVTFGMLRLHHGLRMVSAAENRSGARLLRRHRILLAPAPGDQHSFGLSMLGLLFREAGWTVTLLQDGGVRSVAEALQADWFGVLGISLGSERHIAAVAGMLPRLRAVSRNPALSIMVGGPPLLPCPEVARQMGADATAQDGVQATLVAENLLAAQVSAG